MKISATRVLCERNQRSATRPETPWRSLRATADVTVRLAAMPNFETLAYEDASAELAVDSSFFSRSDWSSWTIPSRSRFVAGPRR